MKINENMKASDLPASGGLVQNPGIIFMIKSGKRKDKQIKSDFNRVCFNFKENIHSGTFDDTFYNCNIQGWYRICQAFDTLGGIGLEMTMFI